MDLERENLITFSQAARRLPCMRNDRPVSPSTLFRWSQRGLLAANGERVRLESRRIGRTFITSTEALNRFVAALSGDQQQAPVRSPAERDRASAAASRKLDSIGFGVRKV